MTNKSRINKSTAVSLDTLTHDPLIQTAELIQSGQYTRKLTRLLLPTFDGYWLCDLQNIIRLEAANNYTKLIFSDKKDLIVSKSIKKFEDILINYGFVRIHSKHLININYIERFIKGKSAYVILRDQSEIPISQGKKSKFSSVLKENTLTV
ncbi:LytTR family transcriptional regulator [bacterium]|nr:LytTR family transcriptional regulator [bacterium]